MMQGIISSTKFVPHTYEHILAAGVYPPGSIPEPIYKKTMDAYAGLHDVSVSRITYESDGLKVNGLMALPANLQNASHSILIYNRGGNREYGKLTVLSAMRSMVPFAQKGYIVFASNYRGNDGGEGQDEFGGRDVDDVLNLLKIARAHPGFDGKNAYMLGHSRGGMMTYMSLRRGAEVNAAIIIAGMTDIRQVKKERPEMEERVFKRLIPAKDADRDEAYDARSAITWANEIPVPLLLLHGDADEAVHVEHTIRMAEVLKQAGCTHEFYIYPKGNHALIRYWDDVLARCNAWMEKWRR